MIHVLKVILSSVVSEETFLGRSASSVSVHAYFEQIYLIYSICFKPKSERESLTKLSSLNHSDISFSPSALFRLPGTEMLPEDPVSNFSKLSLSSKSA